MNTAELEVVNKIKELDLEPIGFKLVTSEHGRPPHMTLAQADAGVALYRQFLILNALYPDKPIVPTEEIDEIWHTHILDTMKYGEDCAYIFGRFLHHFPYLGLRGEADVAQWQEAFAETRRLFREHFGTELGSNAVSGSCLKTVASIDQTRPRPERVPV